MKENNLISYMIILGVIVLGVFCYVAAINILPDNVASNPFFSKTGEAMKARIENIEVVNHKLVVTTSGDAKEVCVKSTVSDPSVSSICWISVSNDRVELSVYDYKTYYVWIKDSHDSISNSFSYRVDSKK